MSHRLSVPCSCQPQGRRESGIARLSRVLPVPAAVLVLAFATACVPDPAATPPSVFDLRPPTLLEVDPTGTRSLDLRFDEDIAPVDGSFALEPGPAPSASAEGQVLRVGLAEDQEPGRAYRLLGEVRDDKGNESRFLLEFTGYNGRPAGLRITEVQTAKNSSTSRPHRDFIEFEVASDGNLGGMEVSASSSVKTVSWRFPGRAVHAGELVVLHCAPEGIAAEVDETGSDLLASGGIDSSPARDFWSKAGGLPDATGVLVLRESPGGKAVDGLFYADIAKTGPLADDRIGLLVDELLDFSLWSAAGVPAWEDAFDWKPSSSRSILRRNTGDQGPGAAEWTLSATGAQSPGVADLVP